MSAGTVSSKIDPLVAEAKAALSLYYNSTWKGYYAAERLSGLLEKFIADRGQHETPAPLDLSWLEATAKYGSRKDDRHSAQTLLDAIRGQKETGRSLTQSERDTLHRAAERSVEVLPDDPKAAAPSCQDNGGIPDEVDLWLQTR